MIVRRRTIEVRGETASWREAGVGVPAIVTAGLGLSSRFYEYSYAAFADAGIRLIVPDLPGWGETPGPLTGLSPLDTTAFLLAFADAIGVRRAVWIGHSLGAQVVAELAVQQPERALGIVMVGPTGAPGRFRLVRQAAGLAIESGRTSARFIAAVAREYIRTPPSRYIGTWLRHSRHQLEPLLPHVTCPALIITGDNDPITSRASIERMLHRLPHGEVAWVAGGTHALPRGDAAEFNGVVAEFVKRIS
ncbi:alpha/beta hydrolase [soil metagenome]